MAIVPLFSISNLRVSNVNARKPFRFYDELIASVLTDFALGEQCPCDLPDDILSAMQKYFNNEIRADMLIDKLKRIGEIAELSEAFPDVSERNKNRNYDWAEFAKRSEWHFTDNESLLVLNGTRYVLARKVLILSQSPIGDFIIRRYGPNVDSSVPGYVYAPIGGKIDGDTPLPADTLTFFEKPDGSQLPAEDALPHIPEEDFFSISTVQSADAQQRAAITSGTDKNLVILAGAGSGKTRTLVCRLAYLHLVSKISLNKILLLTFTRNAANEMRKRSMDLIDPIYEKVAPSQKAFINARTIDSFVLQLIDDYYAQMGFTQKPEKCLDDRDEEFESIRLDMLKSVICENDLIGVFRYCFGANGEANPRQFRQLYRDLTLYADGLPIHCAGFDTLIRLYLDKQREQGKIMGFTEARLFVREAVQQEGSFVVSELTRRFSCILIDEFQDINILQNSILESLYATSVHFTFVGDDDQSIYYWRGSDNTIIQNLLNRSDTIVTYLLTNYRNNPNIVKAGNAILNTIEGRAKKGQSIRAYRKDGAKIRLATYDPKFTNLVNEINHLRASGQKDEEICILCRSTKERDTIVKELIAAAVPVAKLSARININDNYKLLKAIICIINETDVAASVKEISRITSCNNITEQHIQNIVLGRCKRDQCAYQLLPVKELSDELRQSTISTLADAVYRYSIKAGELFEESVNTRHSDAIFEVFEEFCRNNSVPWPVPREQLKENFRTFENDARSKKSDRRSFPSGVRINTIHGVKGLEYNVVIITGLSVGEYPSTYMIDKTCSERMEQLRTFRDSRTYFYALKEKITPGLIVKTMSACDNCIFSHREKAALEDFQAEIYSMQSGLLALSADGVSEYLDAYRFYVTPLIESYKHDINEQENALLIRKADVDALKDKLECLGQEHISEAGKLRSELKISEAKVDEAEKSLRLLNQKRSCFLKAIQALRDFHSICVTASGFLADMEKADEMEIMQDALQKERQQRINEERRLFYVAVTRARDFLYLCRPVNTAPSEFMKVIPTGLTEPRILLTCEEENELQRLAKALHAETSKALVDNELEEMQAAKLFEFGQNKFELYLSKRAKEFYLEHPIFSGLSSGANHYYIKAIRFLFMSEITGGEFKTEFAHNMQRMAEVLLEEAAGRAAKLPEISDASVNKIIQDIRTVSAHCLYNKPSENYLKKQLNAICHCKRENLKSLKSLGIIHYIVRSNRYKDASWVLNSWNCRQFLTQPSEFLTAVIDLANVRNILIHDDPDKWPSDPVPLILANAETVVSQSCKKESVPSRGTAQSPASHSQASPLTEDRLIVGLNVEHVRLGQGKIADVQKDRFTVEFTDGICRGFFKSAVDRFSLSI